MVLTIAVVQQMHSPSVCVGLNKLRKKTTNGKPCTWDTRLDERKRRKKKRTVGWTTPWKRTCRWLAHHPPRDPTGQRHCLVNRRHVASAIPRATHRKSFQTRSR